MGEREPSLTEALDELRKVLAPAFEQQTAKRSENSPAALERLAKIGVSVASIGGNCPVQSYGTVDGQPFYFRARGDEWSLDIGPKDQWHGFGCWRVERDYGDCGGFDAGWMPEDEALAFIADAVAEYRARHTSPRALCEAPHANCIRDEREDGE